MSAIGLQICDICGKRMPEGKKGNLVLQAKEKGSYQMRTKRNWACCKLCLQKLIGLTTKGDYVKEDIESLIDEHCGKRERKVLTNKKKKAKDVLEVFQ
jgi:hypothetical protein